MDGFSYFLVRVRAAGHDAPAPALDGRVQRLGTGEDLTFESAEELARIVAGWSDRPPKMRPPSDAINDPESENGP